MYPRVDSPSPITDKPVSEGQSEAFIEYPPIGEKLEHVPIHVRPELYYYMARMGFLPNTLKLYLHTPWIAEYLFRLNNAIMRDERNSLNEHLKYRLAFIASRDNECTYCTAHISSILTKRWGYEEESLADVLHLDKPQDEREAVAMEFVHQATLDAAGVSDELRGRLAAHFTPQEVMEIVLIIGFWKMYNTMHNAMAAPLEDPVLDYANWVRVGAKL
jgi:alkylhydroperoxidase family enzyme